MAHTADAPYVTDLIAGGGDGVGTDVGEVQVWNDADNLYVKYVVDVTDCFLTETHLAIESSLADIPQTKTGNPKIGKFEFSREYEADENTLDDTYAIPLEELPEVDTLTIAAARSKNANRNSSPNHQDFKARKAHAWKTAARLRLDRRQAPRA